MPEAVIVDAVRLPIGAGVQGLPREPSPRRDRGPMSSTSCSSATRASIPKSVEEVFTGVRHAPGPPGLQPRPDHGPALREAPAGDHRRDRVALLRLEPRRHPPRRQRGAAPARATRTSPPASSGSRCYNERSEAAGGDDQNDHLKGQGDEPDAYIQMGYPAVRHGIARQRKRS